MPTLFLSPSTQEFNNFVGGGTEEYYMNLIADEMIPYLRSSGIKYERNNPSESLSQIINQSNAGRNDLHLAIHSNASPESLSGILKGTDIYYYPASEESERAADIIASNFRKIYPNPSAVKAVPTTDLAEIRRTRAPAVLIEVAYHDNVEDAQWIRDNTEEIAKNLVQSVTQFFDIPFIEPRPEREGLVSLTTGTLNIRNRPNPTATILTMVPNGAKVRVINEWQDWYIVEYNDIIGYARSDYITLL